MDALTLTPRNVRRFLEVSYGVYRGDPCWVAPLVADLEKVFSPANPMFEHAEMALWVAHRDGRDVGRIAGLVDRAYNEFQKERSAFFGFFECVHDPEVSAALFEAVSLWGRQKGMDRLLGPMNPTTNDECGLLVDGFDRAPVLMMPYNPRYYAELAAAAGLVKAKDLLAYVFDLSNTPMERFERLAAKFQKRNPEIAIVPLRKKTFDVMLSKIQQIYNEAWEANWGFVPMTDAEIQFLADRLRPLLTEGLAYVAETPQEPVGFLLALPDFNEALAHLRGRLLTPGWVSALPYFLGWKVPRIVRVITLGVKRRYRGLGIEAAMLAEGLRTGFRLGFREVEASWILEDNVAVQRVIGLFGGRPYKTYRVYERPL